MLFGNGIQKQMHPLGATVVLFLWLAALVTPAAGQSEMPQIAWKAAEFLESQGNKVTRDSEGYVTEIDMEEIPSGFLMGDLAIFPKLESFKVDTRYYFDDGNMGGASKLKTLKKISVENSRYFSESSLEILAEMPALEQVELIECSAVTHLHDLANIRNLKHLRLAPDDDMSLAPLVACKSLTKLDLKGGKAIDDAWIEPLAQMKTLEMLDLTSTSVTDEGIQNLAALANLKILTLEKCKKFTGEAFDAFPEDHPLEELNLRESGINDQGLASCKRFTNLKKLLLSKNPAIVGTGFSCLEGMRKLTILSCPESRITDDHLKLLDGIETLEVIWLFKCQKVSGKGLDYLTKSQGVYRMSLNHCKRIDSPDLEVVGKFKNMKELYLGTTRIRSEGMAFLSGLEKLERLNVGGNIWLDDSAFENFKAPKLKTLFVGSNRRLTNATIRRLAAMPDLEFLSITATKDMNGEGFLAFRDHRKLKTVRIYDPAKLSLEGCAAIAKVKTVEKLELKKGEFSLLQFEQLTGMPNLTKLVCEFESNHSSDQISQIWGQFPNLKRN